MNADERAPVPEHLQIGEVAAATELSIKTIRHYDEVGLVAPSARSAGGFRLYTRADIDRLLVIRRMKPLGFSLEDMGALLDAQDKLGDNDSGPSERAAARERLADFHARAEDACRRLARQLDYAQELTAQLAAHLGEDSDSRR
ncbi:MerR family transcriptional regulator [Gordonia sp. 'Campus']|uniref:MerR family transcriptional regulator n=1 Tax=Gordonia sp. 'Campus' TaxID=2915824 RepID=UPI001EE431A7|nr:MerR family transcriptional regulator [Gordonia sp. 'Campus']